MTLSIKKSVQMKQMLNYRTVLLSQTGFFRWHWGIHHISYWLHQKGHRGRRSHSDCTYIPQPETMDLQATFHWAKGSELPLSRSGTLTQKLIGNPAMPCDEPSNRQSINTGLRLNRTTPALILIGCGRACKLLQTTKGSSAESCPVTRSYQTS